MSKEIYINTGTTFQQQYTARQPAIGTTPVTAQYDAQGNANSQTPYTYQDRSPYTFRSPVSNQTPYIANAQQPYPYIGTTQQPYIANAQQPYPYPAAAQNPYPYIANAQQPYPYIANSQTPFTYQHRVPFTYPRSNIQGQNPFTYQHQQPFTYPRSNIQGQNPFTHNVQTPVTYPRSNIQGQNPFIAQGRSPYPANKQTSARNSINVQYSLGSGIQHTKTDHTPSGQSLSAQVYAYESANEYIVWRAVRVLWRVYWWRHSNGYGYAYWYVKRSSTGSSPILGGTTAQNSLVYLTQGNVAFNTSNWRLVEQWSFWNSIWPDSLSLGSLSPTATTGSLPLATTSGSNTTNAYEGYKELIWECEEGFAVPSGGQRNTTYYMTCTAIKSNYPNLTGGQHGTNINGRLVCDWSPYCFVAGSKVLLEDNTTKNIEDMQVGDTVIGKDGIVNAVKELRTHACTDAPIYTINGELVTTSGHPILTTEGWKSCDATEGQKLHPELNITELAIGDKLLKDAGNANGDTIEEEVTTLTVRTESEITVYNLDVTDSPSGNDTYVVNNYIVHNK